MKQLSSLRLSYWLTVLLVNGSIMLWVVLLISCRNTRASPDTTTDSSTDSTQVASVEQTLELPSLKPDDQLVYQDDNIRILEKEEPYTKGEGIGAELNIFEIQPKKSSYQQFSIKGSILDFEHVLGKTLILSEGTGTVRTLWVYDLTTGKEIFEVNSFNSKITIENDHQFSFYLYDNGNPKVYWNKKKHKWENRNEVPNKLQNAVLEEAKKKMQTHLFDGLTLMAQQKMLVDIQTRKITPLDQYKWGYIE